MLQYSLACQSREGLHHELLASSNYGDSVHVLTSKDEEDEGLNSQSVDFETRSSRCSNRVSPARLFNSLSSKIGVSHGDDLNAPCNSVSRTKVWKKTDLEQEMCLFTKQ